MDLNTTAVELAEISLWLDTMTADLKAPWFGLHLRHGNSLIGSRRATISASSVTKKDYLKEVPIEHGAVGVARAVADGSSDPAVTGRIHHFLLPSNGWGAAADAKDLKDISGDEQKAMKTWRKSMRTGFTKTEVKQLVAAADRVEALWQLSLVRWRIAEDEARRDINVWGQKDEHSAKNVTRAEIEESLYGNPDSPYQRLRLIMDAWNALWFWPLTETETLPDKSEWLSMLADALGTPIKNAKLKTEGQWQFGFDLAWEQIDYVDSFDRSASGMLVTEDLLNAHSWLKVVQQVAAQQAFFHWDLDFSAVMSCGGFDLQVGNPPWVRPRTDLDALYAEHDPWFALEHKPTQKMKRARRTKWTNDEVVMRTVVAGISESVATADFLSEEANYPHLIGQQPDLYRGFMESSWRHKSTKGVVGLIHPESHFTEIRAAILREGSYRRLRRHWNFTNQLLLFDIDNHVTFGVQIYGEDKGTPSFLNAASIHHPNTLVDSLCHNGNGPLPGFKDDAGKWDLRPHKDRIINVNNDELSVWKSILEDPDTPLLHSRMVYTVNTDAADVINKLASSPRMNRLNLSFSRG